jgi:hypothetical protein
MFADDVRTVENLQLGEFRYFSLHGEVFATIERVDGGYLLFDGYPVLDPEAEVTLFTDASVAVEEAYKR